MKIFLSLLFLGVVLSVSSCNEHNTVKKDPNKLQAKDSTMVIKPDSLNTISLSPIKNVPKFDNKEVNNFIQEIKIYFEQMAEANKIGNDNKIIELQLKANDIDENYKKVLKKLNTEQQKKLTEWYMQLVDTASK
ncbi:hypothetical protein Ga0061079_11336 [Apibacter mensalis]|uniref:Uncharacterized protein n=1 Tax=Apibacter mensalis TaxID=1586267 RepID=A0A0X3ARI4_9FLAO|nr:hypothetical protein [Apibacter mensalis]CVK16962.1 hypothetical protein Ga0061079_11336 [Apibacter mensalis]